MPTPQDVIARLYRAFNTRNFDAYAQCLTPDFQLRAKGGGSVRGVEACKAFDREWVSAFPDGHITMEKQVADASNVMAECRFVGTHTGALRGAAGEVPATGKKVEITYMVAFEFQGDKITSEHVYYDQLELLQQLGLTPVPGHG
jgi:steroid delta-isomerase-like uncharacterized protein